jgi:hypothetical protein
LAIQLSLQVFLRFTLPESKGAAQAGRRRSTLGFVDADGGSVTSNGQRLFRKLVSDPAWNIVCSWSRPGRQRLDLGSKADGLVGLPQSWVPAWFAVVPSNGKERQHDQLSAEVERRMFAGSNLLVRSNGPLERYSPGAGRSTVVAPSWDALGPLLEESADLQAMSWPLVQIAIEPAGLGVISNDRALTPNERIWIAEGPLDQLHAAEIQVNVSERTLGKDLDPLLATSDELRVALRRLAAELAQRSGRQRCEWLWDGRRVWAVQADPLPVRRTDPLARELLSDRHRQPDGSLVSSRTRSEWPDWNGPKVSSWRFFAQRNWPVQPLHVLRAGDGEPPDARAWLAGLLATYPQNLVLRTDKAGIAGDLLPTSLPSRDVDYLASFADAAFSDLLARDPSVEAAVLASPLIPARVSALARVLESGAVQVDALWGYPDGLLYLPADSYLITGDTVEPHLVYKPACLLLADAERRQAALGDPYDWAPTLRGDEARQLASWTRTVDQEIGPGTVLMALAHIGGRRGPEGCAPFHALSTSKSVPVQAEAPARRHGLTVDVRGPEDLPLPPIALRSIRLLPQPRYERDIGFLSLVAQAAREREVPIHVYGSRLSHTRYLLDLHGATTVMDHRERRPGMPMLVRTPRGLLRLREVDLEPASDALRRQLARSSAGSASEMPDQPPEAMVLSVLEAGFAHENFPTVPWLADDVGAGLPPTRDLKGEPARFMDDADLAT